MKKILIISLVLVTLSFTSAFAVQRGTSITANPLGLLFGIFNLEANFSVAPNLSVPVSGMYFGYSTTDGDNEWDFQLIGLGVGLRYYWQKKAVNGWYLGAVLNYNNATVDLETEHIATGETVTGDSTASAISYGFLIGYQSIWDSGFTLDFGLGAQLLTLPDFDVEVKKGGVTEKKEYDGASVTIPLLQLALGYAF